MPSAEPVTEVIYKLLEGEVIAVFPGELGTYDPSTCSSYMHVGQHGIANARLMAGLRRAYPAQYVELHAELQSLGYNLRVIRKFQQRHLESRRAQLAETAEFPPCE